MLYLDIARSPLAHARIKNIDTSKALKIPGVVAVITGKDLVPLNLHWMPTLMSDKQMVLPTDTVLYQAQEVAAVVATERYIAADGVDAIEVDYEPLPVVVDPSKRCSRAPPSSAKIANRKTTTSGTGRSATRPAPTRRSRMPRSSSSRTSTSRGSTFRRSRRAASWRASTKSRASSRFG